MKLQNFEYDNLFKNQFTPKPDIMRFSQKKEVFLLPKKENSKKIETKVIEIEEKETKVDAPIKNVVTQESKELIQTSGATYEIRNITPKKSIFRRLKNV